jgi:hypothetical protein
LPFSQEPQDSGVAMAFAKDFEEFWKAFPRRVGKLDAQKAYERARRRGVTRQQILDGIASYIKGKPNYADFCHPATWLNKGRWDDEYDSAATAKPERAFTATELQQARDWYRMVGTELDKSVPSREHMANFIRRLRLES